MAAKSSDAASDIFGQRSNTSLAGTECDRDGYQNRKTGLIVQTGMSTTTVDRALFAGVVFLFLAVISDVVTRGMMPDGTLYAGIARQLAAGDGSFWFPPNYLVDPASFHDHPPFGLWLQSLFFSILGDAFWVENAHAVAMLLLTCIIIYRLAIAETGNGWYAVLTFLIFPTCAFTYTNNFLENTVALLTLASVAAAVASVHDRMPARLALASGFLIVLATLTKGPVGLFPLAVYPLMWLCGRSSVNTSLPRLCMLQLATVCGVLAALLLLADTREAARAYIDAQLVSTFSGARQIQFGRTYLLSRLGFNLVGPILCAVLLLAAFRLRPLFSRAVMLYFLIALSASLPLLISPRQYIHYLLPSFPFFALAIAVCASPVIKQVSLAISASVLGRRLALVVPFVMAGVLCISIALKFGNISDDPAQLNAAARFAEVVPAGAILGLCEGEQPDLRLRMYLFRFYTIRVEDSVDRPMLICTTPDTTDALATNIEGTLITLSARTPNSGETGPSTESQ